jgi:glutamate/aspartate transport system substrate-binding protein
MSICFRKGVVTAVAAGTLVCLVPGISGASDTLAKVRETKTITIGYQEGSVPFSFLDGDKKPTGYAIELCLKFAEAIQKELKLPQLNIAYLPVNSFNRIPAIVEGRADLECGTTTNTPERRKSVAFTIPHFIASARLMVKADSPIKNWSDLRGKTIVMTKGAVQEKVVKQRNEASALNMKILEGKDHLGSFHMLENGEVDAFAMGDVVLYGLRALSKNPEGIKIVGDPLSAEPYAAMFRKEEPALKAVVDKEMARIMYSGELEKLYEKWFRKPVASLNNSTLNMPMSYLLRDSIRFPSDKVGQ